VPPAALTLSVLNVSVPDAQQGRMCDADTSRHDTRYADSQMAGIGLPITRSRMVPSTSSSCTTGWTSPGEAGRGSPEVGSIIVAWKDPYNRMLVLTAPDRVCQW